MQTIPLENLLYLLIPIAISWYFYQKWIGDKKEVIYANGRMVVQLLLIGYVLLYIFEQDSLLVGCLILFFMLLVSSLIAIRNSSTKSLKRYLLIFFSLTISGLFHLFFILEFILELEPLYQARYVIPLAGMVFASIMTAISLSMERFDKEFSRSGDWIESRKTALKSSMIPQINTLLAVGLVALPGMMTGQILSGVDPLIAVRYQIVIMAVLFSSTALGVIIYFLLSKRFRD